MSNDKVDVSRHKDDKDFDQTSYECLVYLRELLRKEKLGKSCNCEEKQAHYLDLHIYHSNVDKETCEELVVPGKDDGVETSNTVNVSNLNCESYAEEEKVIVSDGLLRVFLLPVEMEEKKESIAEEEAETRCNDIKNLYRVHSLGDCGM